MSLARLGRFASVIALLIVLASTVLRTLTQIEGEGADIESPYSTAVELTASTAFALVGIVLMLRRPQNPIGWLLSLPAVGVFFNSYATYTLLANPDSGLPGGAAAAAIDVAMWFPFVYAVFLVLLTFPSGRIASRRWRWTARTAGAIVALTFVHTLTTLETFDPPFAGYENPLVIPALVPYSDVGSIVVLPIMLLVPVAAFDLFRRFRRSRGEERQQFRWLAFSAGLVVGFFPVYVVLGTTADELSYALFTLVLATFPASIGIAVLKYRLYDIDRILSRTLVYALLTATLGLIYFGLVVGLQAVLQSLSGGSNLAIALTTLLVAALFLPARGRIQSTVDRRFNRRSYDAARTVEAFALRLREQIDLDTLRYELLSVVDETMQPQKASLWLRAPEAGR